MNRILKLFNEDFVLTYLKNKLPPLYPECKDIVNIQIRPHKKNIWHRTYHVVIEFRVEFLAEDGSVKDMPIFCSAHSNEYRKNAFESLSFLWDKGFGKGHLSVPRPLFYSNYFQGVFYRGVEGKNLYYYIKHQDFDSIKALVPQIAHWLAKLHAVSGAKNFNEVNSRIETAYPGMADITKRVGEGFFDYRESYEKIYDILNQREKAFFESTPKRWLIHGDAHPENVICMSKRKIGVIDFADLCLSDFARDLGSFTQQLEYMIMRKICNQEYANEMKVFFLDSYYAKSKDKRTEEVDSRMLNYYSWTAMRTATYFLLKDDPQPERAKPLVEGVKRLIIV